jgi:hypothetical protein
VATEKAFSSTRSRVSWLTTAVQLQWRCSLRRGANGIRRNSPCCGAGVWSRRRRRCGQAPFRCRPVSYFPAQKSSVCSSRSLTLK